MNDLIRPALYNAKHRIIPSIKNNSMSKKILEFVGPICETTDKFLTEKKYQSLKQKLLKFRDDELEHKDIAIEHDGQETPGYKLLKFVVQSGCKAAIKISEKI